jgi:rubredoxin
LRDVFLSDYYELPYYAECPECGTPLDLPDCPVCALDEYLRDALDEGTL